MKKIWYIIVFLCVSSALTLCYHSFSSNLVSPNLEETYNHETGQYKSVMYFEIRGIHKSSEVRVSVIYNNTIKELEVITAGGNKYSAEFKTEIISKKPNKILNEQLPEYIVNWKVNEKKRIEFLINREREVQYYEG